MRRLFSTFAQGWPGAGLLLMRVVAAAALIAHAVARLHTGLAFIPIIAILAALLLIAGLWTPVAGSLTAIIGFWSSLTHFGDLWANILLATLGVAIAMVGPGIWSIDAKLFGWRRIEVGGPKR